MMQTHLCVIPLYDVESKHRVCIPQYDADTLTSVLYLCMILRVNIVCVYLRMMQTHLCVIPLYNVESKHRVFIPQYDADTIVCYTSV